MSKVSGDQNLLFGLLALQTGLINQGALFAAFSAWTRDKARSMAEILVAQGNLDAARRSLLDGLVTEHVKLHGDDAQQSLAAIEAGQSTRERLAQLNDSELSSSVALIGAKHRTDDSAADHPPEGAAPTPSTDGPWSPHRAELLAEQRDCWAQGRRVPVEEYLEREPDLSDHPECILDLIYNEVVLREQQGESPTAEEYIHRFPELSAAIREQFEIHGMFAEQGSSWDSPVDAGRSTVSVGTCSSNGQRFRVLRPHARGGLGAVFVALDTELHREVALKQIHDRLADDPSSRRRFLVEAEIAGGLEHPGIVPVYGVGTYANGRPFYAMRFVRGDSLKQAINRFHADSSLKRDPGRRSLELQKLLRRFLDVCNAIEYAHSRGVLHRDVKPGNIIVGKHGETLVVDWGLAKSVGRAGSNVPQSERTLIPTAGSGSFETLPGSAMGTPAFMSPEQAHGDHSRLGPRSDVYSLGATLFALLAGSPPFDAEPGAAVAAMLDAVWRGEFLRPRSVNRSIDRALEAICLKAMARSPEDRYPTARALGDDIERWIADQPVTAFREPVVRRMRRWGKRNRTVVTAAAVAIVAAFIGTAAVLAVQTQANADLTIANGLLSALNARERKNNAELIASNERERARFELAMAAIKLFHGEVAEDLLLKERQFEDLRNKLLRGAADFYGKLEALLKAQTDRASRIELGRAYYELGELTARIGNKPEALAVHRKSLAARREEAARPDAPPASVLDLAQSLLSVGYLYTETGDTARAQSTYREARDLAERLIASGAVTDEARDSLGRIESAIGNLQALAGDTGAALESYQRALAIEEKLAHANPADTQFQSDLADTHTSIGTARMVTGDVAGALDRHRRALAIRQKLASSNPTATAAQFSLAASHVYIGNVLSEAGDISGALESYRRGLAIHEKMAAANPAVTQFQNDLAGSLYGIGELLWKHGDPGAALESCRRAAAIQSKLAESNPTVAGFQHDLAWTLEVISHVLAQTGDSAGAFRSLGQALDVRQKLVESNPSATEYQSTYVNTHSAIASVQLSTGDLDRAAASYRRAAAGQSKLAAANPAITHLQGDLAWSLDGIGHVQSRKGDPTGALAFHQRALAIREKLVDSNPLVTNVQTGLAASHNSIGSLRLAAGDAAAALESFERAVAVLQKLVDAHPADTQFKSDLLWYQNGVGLALVGKGDTKRALESFRRIVGGQEKLAAANPAVPDFQVRLASSLTNLGKALTTAGSPAEARPPLERAVAIREALVCAHPATALFRGDLAYSLTQLAAALVPLQCPTSAVAGLRRAITLLEGLSNPSGEDLVTLATAHAGLAALAGAQDSTLDAGARPAETRKAIECLSRAVAAGYRNPDIRTDAAFDSLKARTDFQLLLQDVVFPVNPFVATP